MNCIYDYDRALGVFICVICGHGSLKNEPHNCEPKPLTQQATPKKKPCGCGKKRMSAQARRARQIKKMKVL